MVRPLNVLFMNHFYPPDRCGGAGIYAATLAESLRRSGFGCYVLCAGDWDRGPNHFNGHTDDVHRGVAVRRLHVNWSRAPRPFDYLYDNPVLAQHIKRYIQTVVPDLVHVISCYTLSAQAISVATELGIPVVVHLVDMWFICPRHTLLRKDGALCFGSRGDWDCQSCLLWGTKAYRWSGRVLDEHQLGWLFVQLGRLGPLTRLPGLRGMLGDMTRRRALVLDALLQADAVLAPSETLKSLYQNNGAAVARIRHMPYGHNVEWSQYVEREPARALRFGFLGNVLPVKGVHVLVDAFRRLPHAHLAELHIFGHEGANDTYVEHLKASSPPGVIWHGAYTHTDLPWIFSQVDVLVFPSVWHENNPLVIQEAFAAGCPVISSDVGGAAECVRDGVDGLHFRSGDADDLCAQMERLVVDDGVLQELRRNIRPVRTIEEEVADICAVYEEVLQ